MTSSTPFKSSPLSPRKSPFRRPESPSSPSPSPSRPTSLRTATPVLAPEDSPSKPTSPLRNSTNCASSSVPIFEDAPIKPVSSLFTKAPDQTSEGTPAKPTSPLRNSTAPPTIDVFEDFFSKPLNLSATPSLSAEMSTPLSDSWTPRGLRPTNTNSADPSPTKVGPRSTSFLSDRFESRGSTPNKSINSTSSPSPAKRPSYGARAMSESNALSKLQPAQVRELRECFQILDRDSDGVVDADDVRDMLNQLGLPSSDRDIEAFFPSDRPQTSTMAVFLTQISTLLATLSPSAELLNAFSAFDDDDSGQVDLTELRDALLHTTPDQGEQALTASEVDRVLGEFSGRRAFGKTMMGGKRGEVFKYQEFVNSIAGGQDKGAKAVEK